MPKLSAKHSKHLGSSSAEREKELDLYMLLTLIRKNIFLILSITLITTLSGAVYGRLTVPIYLADALLHVEKKSSGLSGLGDMADYLMREGQSSTEIEILRSRMVLGSAVDQIDFTTLVRPKYTPYIGHYLARRRGGADQLLIRDFEVPNAYLGQPLTFSIEEDQFELHYKTELLLSGTMGESVQDNGFRITPVDARTSNTNQFILVKNSRQAAINALQRALQISERGRQTGIISISYQNPDRERARSILSAVTSQYQMQNVRRNAAEAEKSLGFLQDQIPSVKDNLIAAEERLNSYRLQSRSVNLDLETSSLLNRVIDVEKSLNELEIKETEMSRLFTPNHPSYSTLLSQKQQLQTEKANISEQIKTLPETQQQVLRLTRDVQVNQEIYLQLVNRMQELDILKAGTVGNVRILDEAEVKPRPISPNMRRIILSAFLFGLMISGAWIALRLFIRRGIENVEQLEEEGISVSALILLSEMQLKYSRLAEKNKKRKRKRELIPLLAETHPDDLAVESLRSLRTHLHFSLMEAKNNIVMISGTSPGVGKSFLSVNLAAVLAQSGVRVLLVDADMRRGHLHDYFFVGHRTGFSNILQDVSYDLTTCENAIFQSEIEGLDFLPRGNLAANPTELLMSKRLTQFLDIVSARYDIVLIDTPPILSVVDSAIIGRHTGLNFMVIRFAQSYLKEINYAFRQYEKNGVEIRSVVLNGVQPKLASGYGHQYQYGYAYKTDFSADENSAK
jgi:tyrosine-protein kinase Etk/Wzc